MRLLVGAHRDAPAKVVFSYSFRLSNLLCFAVVVRNKGIWYGKAGSKVIDKKRLLYVNLRSGTEDGRKWLDLRCEMVNLR